MNLNSPGRIPGCGSRNSSNLPDSFRARKKFGMKSERERLQTLEQRGCGCIKEFVANAEDATGSRRGGLLPAALRNDFL